MADPWNYAGPVTQLWIGRRHGHPGRTTSSMFAISGGRAGADLLPGAAQGLFFRDTRILSHFEVVLNGVPRRTSGRGHRRPVVDNAIFVSRDIPAPGRADSTLMVFRHRHVGQGMREELVLRNFG